MFRLIFSLIAIALASLSAPALAQETVARVQKGNWTLVILKGKNCFISAPLDSGSGEELRGELAADGTLNFYIESNNRSLASAFERFSLSIGSKNFGPDVGVRMAVSGRKVLRDGPVIFRGSNKRPVPILNLGYAGDALGLMTGLPRCVHPELANGPTFESEREFVHQGLLNSTYLGASYYELIDRIDNQNRGEWRLNLPLVTKAEVRSRCVEHIWTNGVTADVSLGDNRRDGVVLLQPGDFDLPWSDLVSVRSEEDSVLLMWRGATRESSIKFGNGASVTRMAAAIEAVRKGCQ